MTLNDGFTKFKGHMKMNVQDKNNAFWCCFNVPKVLLEICMCMNRINVLKGKKIMVLCREGNYNNPDFPKF